MSYPKPLSPKSLQKLYDQSGLSPKKIELLRRLFLAGAGLYGAVQIETLWGVYRVLAANKEKTGIAGYPNLQRRDFIQFSGIARREDHPYYVYSLSELYSEEEDSALERFIVLRSLIGYGWSKYHDFYRLEDRRLDYYFGVPDDFLEFEKEGLKPQEQALLDFLGGLQVNRKEGRTASGKVCEVEHFGEYLKDFKFLNEYERFEIAYQRGEYSQKKDKKVNPARSAAYEAMLDVPEARKILDDCMHCLHLNWEDYQSADERIREELAEVGVALTEDEEMELQDLVSDLRLNFPLYWLNGRTRIMYTDAQIAEYARNYRMTLEDDDDLPFS